MNNKVSIIVPIYNQEKYLARCIDSILCQTYDNIEVLLINDGSTDTSAEICKKYASSNSKIKVYTKKNGGVSSSRNYGLEKATGDFVFFLDGDDAIEKNVIENLVENYSEGKLVSCRMKAVRPRKTTLLTRKDLYLAEDMITSILKDEAQGFSVGYLFKKEKISKNKFSQKTSFLEDVIFMTEYFIQNPKESIVFLPEKCGTYLYYQNETSMTNTFTDIIGKLDQLNVSLRILNETTNGKYEKLIDDKKIMLFWWWLLRADKQTVREVLSKYQLPQYGGKSRVYKKFSKYFAKKSLNGIWRYICFRRFISNIVKNLATIIYVPKNSIKAFLSTRK